MEEGKDKAKADARDRDAIELSSQQSSNREQFESRVVQQRKADDEENNKGDLIAALVMLTQRLNQGWTRNERIPGQWDPVETPVSANEILTFALKGNTSTKTDILAHFHNHNSLSERLDSLTETELTDNGIEKWLVDGLKTVSASMKQTYNRGAASNPSNFYNSAVRRGVANAYNKSSTSTGLMIAGSGALLTAGLFTGIATCVAVAKLTAIGGTATAGFPPVAIALYAIAAAALLTSLILFAAYAYHNKGNSIGSTYTAASAAYSAL